MVDGAFVGAATAAIKVPEKSEEAGSTPPAEDASHVSALSADAFLGKWTTSAGQNVRVEHRSEDPPNLLKAILTKGTNSELQLTIKLDNRQWCCGNGVLVLDSNQEHPNEISWMKWSGGVTTWTREKSGSDVAKSCKPEDSTVDAPKDTEGKVSSTTEGSSGKRVVNGMAAEDFLGHWKWQEHDVIVSYLDGSNGRLQVTISNRSQPLVLGLTRYHGADYWLCGNGYLNHNIEYDVDSKQVKSLQWVYLNERTQQVVMSNWTRVTDDRSTIKKSVSDSDSGSTVSTEDKVGTWYEETLDWENEQCPLKTKILGKQDKTPKATKTAKEKDVQLQDHQWGKRWVDVAAGDRKTYKTQQAQWDNHQWVHHPQPKWGNATGYNLKNQKTQQATQGGRNKNGWREVDGWKHEGNNSRKGGRSQQKATKHYQ
eukprot:gnl/MRDRNA2_/MRDRNA2_87475_c0_seq1.p1 gnl/MRDRNA2_/MRDRNA2_87475_c0~~gnl/MRDRNA2_/MRDRNA2_87475_c0_seq1.p1  ORF type:complete len:426 (+),score=86.92 gnl/MRDRNA2_/MRDRNA2_87475_c0_seq1:92-1369(+)